MSHYILIFRQATPNDDIFDQATQATDMEIMSDNNDSDASEDLLGDDEDDLILDEHDQEDPGERSNKSPTRINESDEDIFEGNISDNFCKIIVFYFKTFSDLLQKNILVSDKIFSFNMYFKFR